MDKKLINKYLKQRNIKTFLGLVFLSLSTMIFISFIAIIFLYFFVQGVKYFKFNQLISNYNPNDITHSGVAPFLITTILLMFLTLLISIPVSFFSAMWMSEYCKKQKLKNFLESFFQIFAAIPSLVVGIIGMIVFVLTFRLGYTGFSILSGSLTLTLVLIPFMILGFYRSFNEVPNELRINSYSLGATQFQTFKNVVIKKSYLGMQSTIIVSVARLLGESAPLLLTLGAAYYMPTDFFSQGRSLVSAIFLEFSNEKTGSQEYIYSLIFISLWFIIIVRWIIKIIFWFLISEKNELKKKIYYIKNNSYNFKNLYKKLIKSKNE